MDGLSTAGEMAISDPVFNREAGCFAFEVRAFTFLCSKKTVVDFFKGGTRFFKTVY
jgi:hypothetical protein